MTTRTSRFLTSLFGPGALRARRSTRSTLELSLAAGSNGVAELLETRAMLAGDHPDLPNPFNGGAVGTAITLDVASALTNPQRGRALSAGNQGVSGVIAAGDAGDLFRFDMPSQAQLGGRTRDFVNVNAETLLNPDGTSQTSTLDTEITVYNSAGVEVARGTNNGLISSNTIPTPDAWVGFVGDAGQRYFIHVRPAGTPGSGRTATGTYTLRVDATTLAFGVDNTPVAPPPPEVDPDADIFGEGNAASSIAFRGDEVVFNVSSMTGDEWDSLATAGAIADDPAMLDTHIEVYNSGSTTGVVGQLASDIQAGRLTNAWTKWRSAPESTYYIRVRSDELLATRPSVGMFTLSVDLSAFDIVTDQVTRLAAPDRVDVVAPIGAGATAPQGTVSRLFQFTAQGTGTSFITVVASQDGPIANVRLPADGMTPFGALTDPAVHLINEAGQETAFNDDANGFTAQLAVSLTGGSRYFLVVEGFDRAIDGAFDIFIEAHYTNANQNGDPNVIETDDHVNSADPADQNILNFDHATPIIYGAPFLPTDGDGNPQMDASWIRAGTARGRLYENGDTDLFQFTPPIDMLGSYQGDDGDQGRALYVGGNFGEADRLNPRNISLNPTQDPMSTAGAPNVAVWDADDWWNAGPNIEDPALDTAPVIYPFLVATGQSSLNGPIFSLQEWDPDGAGTTWPSVLMAGGRFTDSDGNFANLAMRLFDPNNNRFVWAPLTAIDAGLSFGNQNDRVMAMTVFDTDPADVAPEDDLPPRLIVGGRFTNFGGGAVNNIFALHGTAGGAIVLENLATGLNDPTGEVRALGVAALEQPDQLPDPDGPGTTTQPPQRPAPGQTLIVGGDFTVTATYRNYQTIPAVPMEGPNPGYTNITVNNVIAFGHLEPMGQNNTPAPAAQFFPLGATGGTGSTSGANGPVNAVIEYTIDDEVFVVIGGDFTAVNGVAAGNVAQFTNVTNTTPNRVPGEWQPYAGGNVADEVFAFTLFEPPGAAGADPFLMAVGGTDTDGFVLADAAGGGWGLVAIADARVRAVTVFSDDEFDVNDDDSLYIGGDFTMINGNDGFNRVAKLDDQNDDDGLAWLPLKGGVASLSEGEPPTDTTSVFALSSFDDDLAGVWDRNERPSGRVRINIAPTTDSFASPDIRIFDSNFNVIYTNDTLNPLDPRFPGAIDPELTGGPGFNTQFVAPGMWGGEVYYIEVSSAGGTGRFTISLSVDTLPDEIPDNGDGGYVDDRKQFTEIPDENQWAIAPELDMDANGDARAFDLLTANGRVSLQTINANITPGGVRHNGAGYLAGIESVFDTDLYQFRAAATGTVEIRLSTFGITDQFDESVLTAHVPLVDGVDNTSPSIGFLFDFDQMDTSVQRTYTSPLDGLLKIFNNDFEQIAENDDSLAVSGFGNAYQFNNRNADASSFLHRDPRIVIPVVAGETYFIQVESAYREAALADGGQTSRVDWRRAIGSYDLMINGTAPSNGIDDYEDGDLGPDQLNATAVPIDIATGDGSIDGIIDDVIAGAFTNPTDNDLFRYIAVNRGTATFTVQPTNPALRPSIAIFDQNGTQVGAGASTTPGGPAVVTLQVTQGQRLTIQVDGEGNTEGTYTLSINGAGLVDDNVKEGDWTNATELSLNEFLGQYVATGRIENSSDDDLFKFTASRYEVARVTISSTDTTMDPFVYVYEINADREDPDTRNDQFWLIAQNDTAQLGTTNASTQFSVTEGRDYYIVVRGSDPNTHFGNYTITVSVTATDDHPDRADFPLATQIELATNFDPLTLTANATVTGRIERDGDDDLFRFTAPASGLATVTVSTPASALNPLVRIYDNNNVLQFTGTTAAGTASVQFNVLANVQYYIQVSPIDPVDPLPETDTHDYTLLLQTEPIDDYANAGEFSSMSVGSIVLSTVTGVGQRNGLIVPSTDSDLFTFTTLEAGPVTVRVTTVGSTLNPKIRIFGAGPSFTEVPGATSNGDTASLSFPATAIGQVFYILVLPNDGATGGAAVGSYTVQVTGTLPGGGGGGGGPDDYADAGEFNDAFLIPIEDRRGFGSISGNIELGSDTDLFKFVPAAGGLTSVQIKTPSGGLVDGRVRIFDKNRNLVVEDQAGGPGITAFVSFQATAGSPSDIYYVLVEPVNAAVGSYTVEVQSQPVQYYLYYPEGFAGSTIDEFVPMVNPNSFAIQYFVYARYEGSGTNPTDPIATGTIQPGKRGGITVSTKSGASLVDRGRPYSLEIRSTGQIGATFSHYDFNVSVGESFTDQTSTTWTFSQLNKDANTFRDFLVFYNPGNTDADLNIELTYSDGTVSSFTQTVRALRRGGVNVDADGRISKVGRFGVKITSSQPIVAALSTYNLSNGGGDGLLGDSDGGSKVGVIPNVSSGGGVTSSLSILNTNSTPVTVTVTASYSRVDLPDLVRVITVPAHRQFSQSLATLGLINGQTAGLRYTASAAVTASVIEYQNGDGDATAAATKAARQWIFGDLFVNPAFAGITYIERLGLYNPGATGVDITLTYLFTDSTTATQTISLAAGDFGFVQIDQQTPILSRPGPTGFSLSVTSNSPIVSTLTHYDLFLNGGWASLGSPIGLTSNLASI